MSTLLRVVLFVKESVSDTILLLEERVYGISYLFIYVSDYQYIRQVVRSTKPDLFLFDFPLPLMTSFEICDRLWQNKRLEDVPAIVMYKEDLDGEIVHRLRDRTITGITAFDDRRILFDTIEQLCTHSEGY